MGAKLIAVRIARFQARRAFIRDVYLSLPKNGKFKRLVWPGDELRAELLDRLQAEEVPVLYVTYAEDDDRDPERIPLYAEESELAAASHADLSTVVKADKSSIGIDSVVLSGKAAGEESLSLGNGKLGGEAVVKGGSETEEQIKVTGQAPDEAQTRVTGAAGDGDEARKFTSKLEEEESRKFTSPLEEEAARKFTSGPEEEKFLEGKKGVLTTNEGEATVGGIDAFHQGTARIRATHEAAEKERDELLEDTRGALTVALIASELDQLAGKTKGAGDPLLPALQKEAKELAAAMQEIIATGKIPEKIAGRFDVKKELDALKGSMAGGPGREKDLLAAVHERAEAGAKAAIDAARAIEQEANRDRDFVRANEVRELPMIAGRFAAYLGYSLGYVDLAFLSELSTAATMHFEGTARNPAGEQPLPNLTRLIVSEGTESRNSVVAEASRIIRFLEYYFRNPLCDRTFMDLVPTTFTSTVESLASTDAAPEAMYVARWRQFIEKGPSFEAHSTCSKATARALRAARPYRGNAKARPHS